MITIKTYLSIEELEKKLKTETNIYTIKKICILVDALRNKRTAKELSNNHNLPYDTVRHFISDYNRFGPKVLKSKRKSKRPRAYMTLEEEKSFLESFITKAEKGEITTQKEIKEAYEKKIGKSVHKSTISRLLKRHKWRKIVPRPKHPHSSKEEQDDFKKKASRRK